jgi:hypothetical protein
MSTPCSLGCGLFASDGGLCVVCSGATALQQCRLCHRDAYRQTGLCWFHQPIPEKPESGRPMCRHCGERPANRCRGMCGHCYYLPDVRRLYPSKMPDPGRAHEPALVSTARDRRPGDPPYRCLWHGGWCCDGPLQICAECRAWYEKASSGLPEWEDE